MMEENMVTRSLGVVRDIYQSYPLNNKLEQIRITANGLVEVLEELRNKLGLLQGLVLSQQPTQLHIDLITKKLAEANTIKEILKVHLNDIIYSFFDITMKKLSDILEESQKLNNKELTGKIITIQRNLEEVKDFINTLIKDNLTAIGIYTSLFTTFPNRLTEIEQIRTASEQFKRANNMIYQLLINKNTSVRNRLFQIRTALAKVTTY